MPILLGSKKRPAPSQKRKFNMQNGYDAEMLAASKLILACLGEVSWSTTHEDGRKIDLFLSLEHPWVNKDRLIIFVQVKSGDSYGEIIRDGFKLKTAAITAAQRTTHNICIIWVDQKSGQCFWAYIHPNSNASNSIYGKRHRVSPATRYDLARCHSRFLPISKGGVGIAIASSIADAPNWARLRAQYKCLLKDPEIICPVLGTVEFTKLGWRHMFRASRSLEFKKNSIAALPYIPKIIVQIPSDHRVTGASETVLGEYTHATSTHILCYDRVLKHNLNNGQRYPCKFIIKIKEEVRFPTDWASSPMLSQKVDRRLVFLGAYYKDR